MNDFILEDEKRGDRAAGEEIDYFADYEEESERDEEDYKYDDFFDPVQSNQQSATAVSLYIVFQNDNQYKVLI
jgi:U3 small nucleolar ribonucleoprotein component